MEITGGCTLGELVVMVNGLLDLAAGPLTPGQTALANGKHELSCLTLAVGMRWDVNGGS